MTPFATFPTSPLFNTSARLGEIRVPTLILAGRHNWITPPEQGAERLRTGITGSRVVLFEQSGHYPFVEEREHFRRTVGEWLAALA